MRASTKAWSGGDGSRDTRKEPSEPSSAGTHASSSHVTVVTSGPAQSRSSKNAMRQEKLSSGAGGGASQLPRTEPTQFCGPTAVAHSPRGMIDSTAHVDSHDGPQPADSTKPAFESRQSTRHPPCWQNDGVAVTIAAGCAPHASSSWAYSARLNIALSTAQMPASRRRQLCSSIPGFERGSRHRGLLKGRKWEKSKISYRCFRLLLFHCPRRRHIPRRPEVRIEDGAVFNRVEESFPEDSLGRVARQV
jgi:hypothetical protein